MHRTKFYYKTIFVLLLLTTFLFGQEKDSLKISFPLQKKYFLHSIDSIISENKSQKFSFIQTAYQPKNQLYKQGMLVRGVTVSTNSDLSLNSSFRLDLSGKISEKIDIIASLTDQNTPIQPQGNTQTLREVDNIFISIKSQTFKTTLGDLSYSKNFGENISMNRKVQGGILEYQLAPNNFNLDGIVAVNRGLFASNIITPLEGIQGPYKLYGKNNSKYIIVIAGSEKVFLNGVLLTRGEQNDYVIDYSTGELFFTSKNIITSYSRVVVDFEYSERNYFRSLYGVGLESKISNSFSIKTSYHRETDDPDANTDFILNNEDRLLLQNSIDSIISKTGVVFVGIDSITGFGKGDYQKIDTLIDKKNYSYYFYNPKSKESFYNVRFTFVGINNGDYNKITSLEYTFVGIKKGSYSPIIILPKPEKHELFSLQSNYKINSNSNLFLLYQGTRFTDNTLNRISGIEGSHIILKGTSENSKIEIGKFNFGKLSYLISGKLKGKNFREIDRIEDPEYLRKWNISKQNENFTTSEVSVAYFPIDSLKVGFQNGLNKISDSKYGNYLNYSFDFNKYQFAQLYFKMDNISGKEGSDLSKSERGELQIRSQFNSLTPSIIFKSEENNLNRDGMDSLKLGSYKFYTIKPLILYQINQNSAFNISHEYLNDSKSFTGKLENYSTDNKTEINLSYSTLQNRIDAAASFRKLVYEEKFKASQNDQSLLFYRLQTRSKPISGLDFDVYAENTQQQGAKFEKRFVEVKLGEGRYRWIDGNKNNVVNYDDEKDFEPTKFDGNFNLLILPTDEFEKIDNSKLSFKNKIKFDELFDKFELGETFIKKYSYDILLKFERKGKNTNLKKYFTAPSLSKDVLHANLFTQQQIFYQENNREFNVRYRHLYREQTTSFLESNEVNFVNEHSVRTQVQILKEVGLNLEAHTKSDKLQLTNIGERSRKINFQNYISEISYRPIDDVEILSKFEFGNGVDNLLDKTKVEGTINLQSIRATSKIFTTGQLRAEISREEGIISTNQNNYINDFYLLQGKQKGKTYMLTVSADARLESNLVLSAYYFGRANTNYSTRPIHTAKVEVKVLF